MDETDDRKELSKDKIIATLKARVKGQENYIEALEDQRQFSEDLGYIERCIKRVLISIDNQAFTVLKDELLNLGRRGASLNPPE